MDERFPNCYHIIATVNIMNSEQNRAMTDKIEESTHLLLEDRGYLGHGDRDG